MLASALDRSQSSPMRVIYSTTDRAYLLLNGETVSGQYPSRQDAVLAQLEQAAPQALALAQRIMLAHPDLATRAVKAVELYANGHVFPTQKRGHFRVVSQSGSGEFYSVQLNGHQSCTCFDAQRHAPLWRGTRVCKHIMAAAIHQQLETK